MPLRTLRTCALALLVVAASCTDSTGGAPAPASLRLSEAEPVVEVGGRKRLEVTVLDDRGRPITGVPLRFASSRPELADVDSLTGVVTAVAPGTAEITVRAGTLHARVPVTVPVPGGTAVDSFALEPGGDGAVLLDVWSLPAKSLRFHASNAQGTSLCGLVPLTLRSDTTVFVAQYAPRGGDPCLITLHPRRNGAGWLRASAGGVADSVRVTVRGMGFRWVLSKPQGEPHPAGSTVRYELFVVGEDGRRVAGVPVRFTHWGSGQSADVVVHTDKDGFARVVWRLPTHPRVISRVSEESGSGRQESVENEFSARVTATLPDGTVIYDSASVAVVGGPADHIEVVALRTGERESYYREWDDVYHAEHETYASYRTLVGDSVVLRRFSSGFSFNERLAAYTADRYGNPTGYQLLTVTALTGATPSMQPHDYQEMWTFSHSIYYFSGLRGSYQSSTTVVPGAFVGVTNLSAPFPRARLTFSAAGVPSRTVTVVGVDSIP